MSDSDSNSGELALSTWRQSLLDYLSSIETAGDFSCNQSYDVFVHPGLEIDGYGQIPLRCVLAAPRPSKRGVDWHPLAWGTRPWWMTLCARHGSWTTRNSASATRAGKPFWTTISGPRRRGPRLPMARAGWRPSQAAQAPSLRTRVLLQAAQGLAEGTRHDRHPCRLPAFGARGQRGRSTSRSEARSVPMPLPRRPSST